jgi:hypothetical protein
MEALAQKAATLRGRIAESETRRESQPRRRAAADAQVEAWRRQMAALEDQVREEEGRFADRARQAGALPGWLR